MFLVFYYPSPVGIASPLHLHSHHLIKGHQLYPTFKMFFFYNTIHGHNYEGIQQKCAYLRAFHLQRKVKNKVYYKYFHYKQWTEVQGNTLIVQCICVLKYFWSSLSFTVFAPFKLLSRNFCNVKIMNEYLVLLFCVNICLKILNFFMYRSDRIRICNPALNKVLT